MSRLLPKYFICELMRKSDIYMLSIKDSSVFDRTFNSLIWL